MYLLGCVLILIVTSATDSVSGRGCMCHETIRKKSGKNTCVRDPLLIVIRRTRCTHCDVIYNNDLLVLIASCKERADITYTWWHNATLKSNTSVLQWQPTPFINNVNHLITVEAKSSNCDTLRSTAQFAVRTVVTNKGTLGHCRAEPREGCMFAVHCTGFELVVPGRILTNISYRYFVISTPKPEEETLYENRWPSMPQQILHASPHKGNNKRFIYIYIRDSTGWGITVSVSVVVTPCKTLSDDVVDRLTQYLYDNTSETVLDKCLSSEDFQGAFTNISSVYRMLTPALGGGYTRETLEKIYELQRLMLSTLSHIKNNDIDVVLGKARCLNVISDHAPLETQAAVLDIYVEIASYLKNVEYANAPNADIMNTIEDISKTIIEGVITLINRPSLALTDLEVDNSEDMFAITWTHAKQNKGKHQKRNMVRKALAMLEYISKLLLHSMNPGQEPLTIETSTISQVLKKDTAARLSQQLETVPRSNDGASVSFKLPTLGSPQTDVMGLHVFKLSRNPYTWHFSAKQVNSDVVGLSIYREDGQTVRLKNVTQPVVISIPRKRETIAGILHFNMRMTQHDDTFSLKDLDRFTADVACNKNYQIILSPHLSKKHTSIFLIVKTEVKVFVRDFFRDSRKERNITLLTVNFHNQKTHKVVEINKANNAGLEYVVEGRGVVSLFGRMSDRRPRCQLYIGMLPTFYDSVRCKLCEAEYNTCGFCNSWTVAKKTNRKLVDSSDTYNDAFLNISATAYTNDCLYWNENAEKWTNDGCQVSMNSSAAAIVCECRHLSVFSANMLIQPNKVDLFNLSLFLHIFNNPVVVAIVIGTWCIYALLMVWARRKDHEDLKKQGVIVISTAVDAEYYYMVTVITGWQPDAGTSATVAMYMIGSLGISETLVLTDPTRFVHVSGAESWFLIATTETLGQLLFLRIWHNCSGIFPSWFLKQITIRDIQTNQVWTFICDDWLTPEKGMHGIKKSLYANENKRSRLYDFRLTSMQILRSEHPWISIFSRPVYKIFNRAQRLSVVMSFAMISMLTNIMFYGEAPTEIEEGALGGIVITKEQLIISIESFLMCIPINILIWAIFTNVRPRENRDLCIEFDVLKKSFWKKKASTPRNNSADCKPEGYDDDLLINLHEMKPLITSSNAYERDESSTLSSNTQYTSTYISPSGSSSRQADEIHEAAEKAKGCLPWWFLYIGWTMTVGTGIVSSFVTIMYSLTYGYARSVAWTVSFFSAFFQETGIYEPVKITAAAAFVTFIAGSRARPNVPDSYTINRETMSESENGGTSDLSSSCSSLPTRNVIQMGASVIKKQHRMRKWCYDFSLPIVISLAVMATLNSGTLQSAYLFQKSLMDTFVRVRYGSSVTFTEVRTTDEMWRYIKYGFVPSLLPNNTIYVADDTNVLVGLAQIRQLRVVAGPCSNSYAPHRSLGHSCFTPYSFGAEDKFSYLPSWHNLTKNNSNVINQSPWTYRSADETDMLSTWGRYHKFSGGGYIIPVFTRRMLKMRDSLEKLQNASWIDEKTRAVFLEFTIFNPKTHLFASTVLLFELTDFGIIDSRYSEIVVHRVYAASSIDDIMRVVFESIYTILLTWYIVKTVRQFWKMRDGLLQYFYTIWPIVDCVIMLLTAALVLLVMRRHILAMQTSRIIRESSGKSFISFDRFIFSQFVYNALLCSVHFLLMMNVLRWSVFLGKRNIMFAFNIFRARTYICYLAFVFFVVFVMTVLTSQALFGSYCGEFMAFTKAVMNVARLFRYSSFCSENECIHDSPNVSLLFFGFTAFFVVLVLVCGITAQYSVAPPHEESDLHFVDYLMSRLLISSGCWNMDDYIAHEKSEQRRRRRRHLRRLRTVLLSNNSALDMDSDTGGRPTYRKNFFNGLKNSIRSKNNVKLNRI